MTKLRLTLIIAIVLIVVVAVGFRLTQPEPERAAAAPSHIVAAPAKTESITEQRIAVEPAARRPVMPLARYQAPEAEYHLNYPADWSYLILSSAATLFQSPAGDTQVLVELAGPLPADGLAPFVSRSLSPDQHVYSHQLLTVHGVPAERVVTFTKNTGRQQTTFFINLDDTVVVITGHGQQQAIEMIARSFNAPQLVALK